MTLGEREDDRLVQIEVKYIERNRGKAEEDKTANSSKILRKSNKHVLIVTPDNSLNRQLDIVCVLTHGLSRQTCKQIHLSSSYMTTSYSMFCENIVVNI